jgi:nicotinamidase-related amidase
MHRSDELLACIETLLTGVSIIGLPVVFTEQYPKGLGPTVERVAAFFEKGRPVEKVAFSCFDSPGFRQKLEDIGRSQLVIAGIEAHVCVLQTAVDLAAEGYEVTVIADAVASRRPFDAEIAFERMRSETVRLVTVESLLFELLREAGTPRFKEISRLVK